MARPKRRHKPPLQADFEEILDAAVKAIGLGVRKVGKQAVHHALGRIQERLDENDKLANAQLEGAEKSHTFSQHRRGAGSGVSRTPGNNGNNSRMPELLGKRNPHG